MRIKLYLITIILLFSTVQADPPFSPNVLAVNAADTINEGESCMALYQDNLYIICNINERNRIPIIPFGRSTDLGNTWLPTIPWIDQSVGITWHTDPVLLTDDDGNLHMLIQFSADLMKHYLSTDEGYSWSETSFVSDTSTGGSVDKPWMVRYQDILYVAWQELGGTERGLRLAKSTDNGATWTRRTFNQSTGIIALTVSSSGILYLAYVAGAGISFTKSTDEGTTWSTPNFLSNVYYTPGYGDRAALPCIASIQDTIITLTWVDDRSGNWDILAKRSSDGGDNWSETFTLNDSLAGGQCKGWVITDCYDNFHAFWYHTPSWPTSSSSQWSIRYTNSYDGGITFRPSMRITDTTFTSPVSFTGDYHTIISDSNHLYAGWADGRDGNLNLYFSKAPISSLISISEKIAKIKPEFEIFVPSIVNRQFTIKLNTNQAEHSAILNLYDVCGRSVEKIALGNIKTGTNLIPVKIRNASTGIYFLEVSGLRIGIKKKIIVLD